MKEEKERLQKWAHRFYELSIFGEQNRKRRGLNFFNLFKEQVLEYKLMQKMIENGIGKLNGMRVLDVGCGEGRFLRKLVDWGASPEHLAGADIHPPILNLARELSSPGVQYVLAHADELPFEDGCFDVILIIGVLQHVLDEPLRHKVAKELLRVLADGGIIISFNISKDTEKKFPNFLAETTKGLSAEEHEELFPHCKIDFEYLFDDVYIDSHVPQKWGEIYDQALYSDEYKQDYGLVIVKKNSYDRKLDENMENTEFDRVE